MSAARQERFRTACVVGSRGGIGRAVVRRLSKSGFDRVFEMDLAGPIRLDLADPVSVERAFAEARAHAPILDALVVAAGILDLRKLNDLSLERWTRSSPST